MTYRRCHTAPSVDPALAIADSEGGITLHTLRPDEVRAPLYLGISMLLTLFLLKEKTVPRTSFLDCSRAPRHSLSLPRLVQPTLWWQVRSCIDSVGMC